MKKIVTLILLLCIVLMLASCGNVEITTQEIYDAVQTEAMLKNHQSIYVREEFDGELFVEKYLTKDYIYECYPDEKFAFAHLMTDNANYAYSSGDYLLYLFITPDGIGDFVSERAETYTSVVLGEETLDSVIESVSKKDGRITVTSALSNKVLETLAEEDMTSGKFEYVLDAKTRETFSLISDYTYEDGTSFNIVTEVAYDTEAPETLNEFFEYMNQTENLRNVTVVSNPGTEKEESKSIQAPKGLIIGFTWDDAFEDKVELYSDASCTKPYDPYENTDSDLTVYVKWNA